MTKPLQKTPALTVDRLVKTFDVSAPWLNRVVERKPRQYLQAVNDISFTVPAGGCLSIVGRADAENPPLRALSPACIVRRAAGYASRRARAAPPSRRR